MVAFDLGSGTIVQASADLGHWLAAGDLPPHGRTLADLLGDACSSRVRQALTLNPAGGVSLQVIPLPARPAQGQPLALEAVVHLHRGVGIAEFEAVVPGSDQDWALPFGDAIEALRSARSLDELVSRMAQRVRRLTGFDRVMVYRFDKDWNGHVIAEACEPGMEPFLDLHYPASDIPAQAREMFRSQLVRFIADVGATQTPMQPWLNPDRQQPLDMSHAMLRSASPIHLEYLRNMGVGASLTLSLLVEDRLWGLIACHHRQHRAGSDRPPIRLRLACHALSVTAGYMVGWQEQLQRTATAARLQRAQVRVVEAFSQVQAALPDVVEQCGAALLEMAGARAGAFWRDEVVLPFGQWPAGAAGQAVVTEARRALQTASAELVQNEALNLAGTGTGTDAEKAGPGKSAPPAPGASATRICGFMALRLDAFAASGIVWVRPAIRREVGWGGNPDKAAQLSVDAAGRPRLSPRASFARWLEVVAGRCLPWTETDTEAARSLLALAPVLAMRDSLDQLRLSDRRFRSLVALQSDSYCQLDLQGRIQALSKALPNQDGPAQGQSLVALFEPGCDAAEVQALAQALAGGQAFRDLVMHGQATAAHRSYALKIAGESLKDPHGRSIGWHGTITDTTAEAAGQAALRDKEVAEKSNQAKSRFLSQMSHELRTPLNAVLGFAQLLLMDDSVPESQRVKIRHIQRAGQWLLEMIGDLMDLSRIETGNLSLHVETADIREVVKETLAMLQAQATASGIRLLEAAADAQVGPVWARIDRSRLRQVLLNLATNALKYSRPPSDVHFAVVAPAAAGMVRIDVRDSGIGLTPDQLGHLFEPFNRLGRDTQRTPGIQGVQGTGIGLVISRKLVEAMGGTISVESVAGEGSTFSVNLPDAQSAPARIDAAAAAAAVSPPAGAGRVVLYVGDDASNVVLLESIVGSLPGVRLVHAATDQLALAMSRELSPELVLIDVKLSGLPGMHLLRAIKADPRLQHLRCIAVDATPDPNPKLLEASAAAGFEARWTQPLDLKAIRAGLQAALKV